MAIASLVILVKTEVRKWFFFGGEPSSANTFIFWASLGLAILFGLCGSMMWKKSRKNSKELEEKEDEEENRIVRETIESFKKNASNINKRQ